MEQFPIQLVQISSPLMSGLFLIRTFSPFVVISLIGKHYCWTPPDFSFHLPLHCGFSAKTHENEGEQLPCEI